ncbi:hypothetical protein TNCV_2587361 [Trichonephila clavipes]|nr:hypothetical protein TNCV_2587361 [Trichonephila clavipes]
MTKSIVYILLLIYLFLERQTVQHLSVPTCRQYLLKKSHFFGGNSRFPIYPERQLEQASLQHILDCLGLDWEDTHGTPLLVLDFIAVKSFADLRCHGWQTQGPTIEQTAAKMSSTTTAGFQALWWMIVWPMNFQIGCDRHYCKLLKDLQSREAVDIIAFVTSDFFRRIVYRWPLQSMVSQSFIGLLIRMHQEE